MNRRSFLGTLALLPGLGWLRVQTIEHPIPVLPTTYTLPHGYNVFEGEWTAILPPDNGWSGFVGDHWFKGHEGQVACLDGTIFTPAPQFAIGDQIALRCEDER